MEDHHRKPVFYINTLGKFSISLENKCIDDSGAQAKKPWYLLEYLITFRGREIGLGELTDLFWNDERSSNPQGALKTLMCRVRKLLDPLGYPSLSLIIQRRGSYAWNPELETFTDADRFEELALQALTDGGDPEVQTASCLAALDLYKGDFLPKSASEDWVIPISTYYHSLYIKTVHKMIEIYRRDGQEGKIAAVCQRALPIEPFDEEIHYHLIFSLYASGNHRAALEHYHKTVNSFYNEFAITPSERLQDLYKVIQEKQHGITTDLTVIQKSLQEESVAGGAYYCEYTVFKDIYQLENRAIERTGDSIYLCLLTISDLEGGLFKPAVLARAMNELDNAVSRSLRRGDVYTRYSVSQYMLLLPTSTYENGEKVIKRIIQNFKKGYSRKDLLVEYSLQAIVPKQPLY